MVIMCEFIRNPCWTNIIITFLHKPIPEFRKLDQFHQGLWESQSTLRFFEPPLLSPSIYPAFPAFQARASLTIVYRDLELTELRPVVSFSSCVQELALSSQPVQLRNYIPKTKNIFNDLQLVGWLSSRSCRPLVACGVGESVAIRGREIVKHSRTTRAYEIVSASATQRCR